MKKVIKKVSTALGHHLIGKGFIISYACAGSGPTGDETALVKNGKFFILNGDWSKEYEKLIPLGYKACKDFFNSKKDKHCNFWSN